jgi:hypothetical protein
MTTTAALDITEIATRWEGMKLGTPGEIWDGPKGPVKITREEDEHGTYFAATDMRPEAGPDPDVWMYDLATDMANWVVRGEDAS